MEIGKNKFFGGMKRIAVLLTASAALCSCGNSRSENKDKADGKSESVSQSEISADEKASDQTTPPVTPIEYEIDPTKPVIALTFDDGPNTTVTPRVLDLCEKYGVKASFFLIGDNITEESEPVVKRAHDLGCEIDNHSKTHGYMNKMTAEQITDEYNYVSEKVKEITGEPTKFFRPPYIAVNQLMYDVIDVPFINGFGVNDWDSAVTVEERIDGVLNGVGDGSIILLHDADGNFATVEALETIIPKLQEQGYQFATVTELFIAKGCDVNSDFTMLYTKLPQ